MRLRFIYLLALVATSFTLSGCLLNSIHQVHYRTSIEPWEAIVVVGVGLQAPWNYAGYSVSLDEYSLEKQKITGNCFHYNHIKATISSGQRDVKYFAFQVPAGVYVFSAFNATPPPHPAAFIAPKGAVVYFGDYIYREDRAVELRNGLASAQVAVKGVIPRHATLTQADPEPSVKHGTAFLCTP